MIDLNECTWQCGDCGNTYEYSTLSCPNKALDKLLVSKKGHDLRKAEKAMKKSYKGYLAG